MINFRLNNNITYILLSFFIIAGHFSINAQITSEVNSGIFTYKISGVVENGSEIFHFDRDKSRRHKKIKFIADDSFSETLEINDGKAFYIINLSNKTGFKVIHPQILSKDNIPEKTVDNRKKIMKSFYDTLTPIKESLSLDRKEKITFFGKQCKVLSGSIFKTYLWKGHILRQEITIPYTKIKEVTDMKINVKIPDSMFTPPEDITYSPLNMLKLGNILNSLKSKNEKNVNNKKE